MSNQTDKEKNDDADKLSIPPVVEPEDLSGIDMSLPSETEVEALAYDRLQHVIAYQKLNARAKALGMSELANKSVGNSTEAEKNGKDREEVNKQIAYTLRAVKVIDTQNPRVKARMMVIANRPPACPRCGNPI